MSEEITIQEYFDLLDRHDWNYSRAGNSLSESYIKSRNTRRKIVKLSYKNKEFSDLYNKYMKYIRGEDEKPRRPNNTK